MKAVTKVLTGAAGVAALVGMAAPAAAQYYPGYPATGYGTSPVGVIGQVLQSVLNPYGQQQYRMNPQMAINRCTAAVQNRLARSSNAGYGYNPYGGYGGYGAYGQANAYSSARVLGVSRVEQRSRSTLRVRGVASSGQQQQPYGYGYGYGQYGGYPQQAAADLTFKCDIDSRGYIRDIDINRRRY